MLSRCSLTWHIALRCVDNPAGLSLAFAGFGELLTLPFKAMLLECARKSGGPPLFEPSFKVQRNSAHNQSSGFAVAPGLKAHNARGPLKVHPKWRLEESALASHALAPIDRHMLRSNPTRTSGLHREPSAFVPVAPSNQALRNPT